MKKIVIVGALGYLGTELCKIYSGESWRNKIIALEPHPENYKMLKDNVKLNGIENVVCINLGLQGKNEGERCFYDNSNHGGFIMENALTKKNSHNEL